MPSQALKNLKMGARRKPGINLAIILHRPQIGTPNAPGGPPPPPMFPVAGGRAPAPEESPTEEATETPAQEAAEPNKPEDMVREGLQQLADAGHKWAKQMLVRFDGLMQMQTPEPTGETGGAPEAPGPATAAS